MRKIDGEKLANEICRRDLSVADFAKKAGISIPTAYRMLLGKKATFRTTEKMAAALGIEYTELIKQEGK